MTYQSIEEMTVDLDASFKFHCTQCGKCCENRDDIILSPMDIFRMSKELKLTPTEFSLQYCRVNIGPASRMPIVTLQPVGSNDRCPLLKKIISASYIMLSLQYVPCSPWGDTWP